MREPRTAVPTSGEVAAEVLAATLCRLPTSRTWIGVPPPSPTRPLGEPGTLVARRRQVAADVRRRAAGEIAATTE